MVQPTTQNYEPKLITKAWSESFKNFTGDWEKKKKSKKV